MVSKGQDFTLKAFTDADWAGSIDDRKSTSGTTLFLGNCLVSWSSKTKSSILLFTTKAEYIPAASCHTHVIWIKKTPKRSTYKI